MYILLQLTNSINIFYNNILKNTFNKFNKFYFITINYIHLFIRLFIVLFIFKIRINKILIIFVIIIFFLSIKVLKYQ